MLRQLLHRNRLILSVQTRAVTRATLNCKRNHSTIVINATNTAPEDIIAECSKIRESIQNLNDRYKGPIEKSSQRNTILPFVFLLGNHSSGKSSFVNFVCDRKIQTAGVAPTDDMFTILAPGPSDANRDGPSLVGDPDMVDLDAGPQKRKQSIQFVYVGFSGLRSFGPALIHHTKLKVRSNIKPQNFMLVDSPGMIDSPLVRDEYGVSRYAAMDRGYDFEGVCRWFSERADVILLFFDPDKPGTTGETLSILTNSLVGMDHKLHIILNKADQFRKIHDFARAYGSLCWNLSKVIQRKDLPRVYTMCLPKVYRDGEDISSPREQSSALSGGLADLEETLHEVVREVYNAPKRRVDNEITRLTDSISLLRMHMNIVDDLVKQLRSATWQARLSVGAAATGSIAAIAASFILTMPFEVSAAIAGGSLGGTALLFYLQSNRMGDAARNLVTDEAMVASYKRIYARKANEKDEYLTSLWARVHDQLITSLNPRDLETMDKVSSSDVKQLDKILEYDIPNLRRKAAPVFAKPFGSNKNVGET